MNLIYWVAVILAATFILTLITVDERRHYKRSKR
jgi:hypothetical protein